jgi:hypothetical protein
LFFSNTQENCESIYGDREEEEVLKMNPTSSVASSKPYKLTECTFKMLYHHLEGLCQYLDGLPWLWALYSYNII